jgi:hypothetical protein
VSKKEFSLQNYTDLEITQKLEKKFGRDISHIAYRETTPQGVKVFDCVDIGAESVLTVDNEGYVISKSKRSNFGDVLGTI